MLRSLLGSPVVLAALVTVANAAKPVTVDDTAYLAFARHIATNPTDPYGFDIFWWSRPDPAMQVLCPPVVPYWLAAGIRIFGESPLLLKLWLFPFLWLLAWALRGLLHRFARGVEDLALPLLMFSPAVLTTVNLMLDVPAVALGFAAVQLFLGAHRPVAPRPLHPDSHATNWPQVVVAGLAAGLAMQTKYSAFSVPVVIAWFGLTHRRFVSAAIAVAVAVAVFVAWERWLVGVYGQSHFQTHAGGTASGALGGLPRLFRFALNKLDLVPQLIGHVGCLAAGYGFFAVSTLRGSREWRAGLAALWCVGFVLVAMLPRRYVAVDNDVTAGLMFWQATGVGVVVALAACTAVLMLRVRTDTAARLRDDAIGLSGWFATAGLVYWQASGEALLVAAAVFTTQLVLRLRAGQGVGLRDDAIRLVGWLATVGLVCWQAGGTVFLAAVIACAVVLAFRVRKGLAFRLRDDTLVLVGWLAIEAAATIALTPFPAARRVVGVTLVMGVVAARAASRSSRAWAECRPPRWVIAFGVGAGIAVTAIDTLDAFPEKVCAETSAALVRDRPDTAIVWYVGHWGFQYYCERAGMRPLIAGETVARAGDFLVLPLYPDGRFNRPHAGFAVSGPAGAAVEVATIEWDDPLSAQTVPNFYGGVDPVAARDHPRLRVRVYRMRTDWVMPGPMPGR